MKMRLSLVIRALLLIALSGLVAAGAEFYVAPNGNDANSGTAAEPFATVAKARDAVRRKAAAGLDDPDYQARVATALAAAIVEWRAEARQP